MYYDREGRAITAREWDVLFARSVYRQVCGTRVGTYRVSTVWLGLDHGISPMPRPVIFETVVFDADGADLFQERYVTEAEAVEGHERACRQFGCSPNPGGIAPGAGARPRRRRRLELE